ncbi:hypothetical protein PIB30_086469 [Stylosanthes scabra]|uniref:Uncharacterized protein n=1 Tax=Stylosanthes scabra TaxID=79078 RepID=A0ABU6QVH4_9FABA|nr:hypothetical protein [Stylosanthes scabra]
MESTRFPRNVPQQQQDEHDEDEPMPQAGGGNEEEQEQQQFHQFQQPPQQPYQEFQQNFESQYHQACNFYSNHFMRTYRNHKSSIWKRKEQDMLAREIQEIRKGQINQTLVNNQRAEAEKYLQLAVERQARDISEMRKQLNLWTRNASAREAYSCWAHQQANPNLSEISVNHITDLMQTNAERGRPMFYGTLKTDVGASASSLAAQQEPVPLWTIPPLPGFQPPRPLPN